MKIVVLAHTMFTRNSLLILSLQIGQYIGEICRYLLAVAPSSNDTSHSIRMVIGNGMRPDVWQAFVDRFKIPTVLELYGSTEGNANIGNNNSTPIENHLHHR